MLKNNSVKIGGVVDESCYPFRNETNQIQSCKSNVFIKCKKRFKISSSYRINTNKIVNI